FRLVTGLGLLSASIVCLAAFGCEKRVTAASDLTAEVQVSPQPPVTAASTVSIQLGDLGTKPVSGAVVTVEADMTHPGMAPIFSTAVEKSSGKYEAPITFTMRGDWILLVHIKTATGQTLERQIDVKGVAPAAGGNHLHE
ncbi:MAG TPA: FixH family protein, partial [Acidisarcina sp.]